MDFLEFSHNNFYLPVVSFKKRSMKMSQWYNPVPEYSLLSGIEGREKGSAMRLVMREWNMGSTQ